MAMTTLGSKSVGSTISIKINGTATNFIVVQQGKPSTLYDDSCAGTWLLMQNIYTTMAWDSSNNDYKNSDVHSYLNNTFYNLIESDIQSLIKQVKIPYRNGTGSGGSTATGSSGLSTKVFLLSGYELGWTTSDNSYFPVDGARLSYFGSSSSGNSKRIAYYNGSVQYWWTRSPRTDSTNYVWHVNANGVYISHNYDNTYGVRPAFVLPTDTLVDDSGAIVTNTAPEAPSSISADISTGVVTWGEATDAESNLSGYTLERSVASGIWTQLYSGSALTYTDTEVASYQITSGSTVQYRVKAYDTAAAESDYTTSSSYTMPTFTGGVLNTMTPGKSVYIDINGTSTEFILIHVGNPDTSLYDSSCNGAWLVMKNAYTSMAFDSADNDYANSDVYDYLNSTFLNLVDSGVQNVISEVLLPYVSGTGGSAIASGESGLASKVFLLSAYELGLTTSTNSAIPVDGAALDYFTSASKRIANYGNSAAAYWTRSANTGSTSTVWAITTAGAGSAIASTTSEAIRPCFIVSSTLSLDSNSKLEVNSPPTLPVITVPDTVHQYDTITISWTESTDVDGNFSNYVLERALNSNTFDSANPIYQGTTTTWTETTDSSWKYVAYRVKAVDTEGASSAYSTSSTITLLKRVNTPPTITSTSGDSGIDLGTKTGIFEFTYTIADTEDSTLNVTEYVDDTVTAYYADLAVNTTNTFSVVNDSTLYKTLDLGEHILKIVAKDAEDETATFTATFTKSLEGQKVIKEVRVKKSDGTTESIPIGVDSVYVANSPYALRTSLDAHATNNQNPHNTTAAQVNAVPVSGGAMTGALSFVPSSDTEGGKIHFFFGGNEDGAATSYIEETSSGALNINGVEFIDEAITFAPGETGLSATTIQAAIAELKALIDAK